MMIQQLVSALGFLSLLALSACSDRGEPTPTSAADATESAAAPATTTADAPASTVRAAEAAAAQTAAPDGNVDTKAASIEFSGFGDLAFGSDEATVRAAWGRPLQGGIDEAAEGATCFHLRAKALRDGIAGIAFMFEDGRFVRYEVADPQIEGPADIRAGAHQDVVLSAFPGRVEEEPNKYVEGARDLIVVDGSGNKLIVDVGTDGIISGWRVGVPPQVDYVEGCG